jgi:hypothetical protein
MNQVSSYYMPGKYNIIYELYQEIDFGITSITSFVRSIEKIQHNIINNNDTDNFIFVSYT